MLKTGFDLESDTTKIESEATKLHKSINYLLSLSHEWFLACLSKFIEN